jgi:hypothetical protein
VSEWMTEGGGPAARTAAPPAPARSAASPPARTMPPNRHDWARGEPFLRCHRHPPRCAGRKHPPVPGIPACCHGLIPFCRPLPGRGGGGRRGRRGRTARSRGAAPPVTWRGDSQGLDYKGGRIFANRWIEPCVNVPDAEARRRSVKGCFIQLWV